MSTKARIELVPAGKQTEALHFLAAGRARDANTEARAVAYEKLLQAGRYETVRLWWARRWLRSQAAVLLTEHRGRTAALFHSPARAPGVNPEALAELIRAVSQVSLAEGAAFVQSLESPASSADAEVLRAAGYVFLADLVYMQRSLAGGPPAEPEIAGELSWRVYGEFDDGELMSVIECTYTDSLDCRGLAGLRSSGDVLEGHKSSGEFRPDAWWIVERRGAAGCILVNDYPATLSADVVYLGVAPAYRGLGLGRAMLARAACAAKDRGCVSLTLAADSVNTFALEAYKKSGFKRRGLRRAFLVKARAAADSNSRTEGM